ncbi:hypothetical protein GCM10009566_43340 [Streptomyces murinus]|uniref:Uncharacterized protein n=1 Tax=Streptomyces murinus TaxID=33900 RepID=A0A7W3NI87_STRMR|nr:hypothetical protein [Streptomyces murinus]MBA9050933.1 hypothetical protein [Streptomyces murinus]
MISTSWDRSRRIAAASSVLAVIVLAVGVLAVALSVGVPESWWPHTGQTFAAKAHGHRDRCAPIVGRAKAYCERGSAASALGHHPSGTAWRLVPAGAGMAALVVWRGRRAAGRRQG